MEKAMAFIKNPEKPEMPICRDLRTKASYIPDLQSDYYMQIYYPYDQFYCLKTLHNIGPDDRPVCPEDCGPERSCFKPLRYFAVSRKSSTENEGSRS